MAQETASGLCWGFCFLASRSVCSPGDLRFFLLSMFLLLVSLKANETAAHLFSLPFLPYSYGPAKMGLPVLEPWARRGTVCYLVPHLLTEH